MTQENHAKLEKMSPAVKNAYVSAKGKILETLREMDLFENNSLSDAEKETIIGLLNETAFLMNSEEKKGL